MAEPFTAPKQGIQAAFHTGPRAQALPEIVNMDHAQALAAWTQTADGQRAVQVAQQIGETTSRLPRDATVVAILPTVSEAAAIVVSA